eukprot:8170570-Alexandrium_andersonii.AAC.1
MYLSKPRLRMASVTNWRKRGTRVGSVPNGMPTNSHVRSWTPGGGASRGRLEGGGGPRPFWKLKMSLSSAP